MEDLKELVYIVNRNKIKRIDMLDREATSTSKVNAFYNAISDGKANTDEEAFNLLFPGAKSKSAYRNLKGILRDKLLNTLFFIDAYKAAHTDRQTAYYEAYKDFAAVQILLAKNARIVGIDLLEKVLKKAQHYEFTELAVAALRMLRLHYGTRLGKEKAYQDLHAQWQAQAEIELQESKAEQLYTELTVHYVNNKGVKEELQALAQEYYQQLAANKSTVDSYKYHFYTGLVQLFGYTCVNDYGGTIPVCDELITYFEAKPFQANTPIQICLHHQLVACLQLGDYQKGTQVAHKSRQLIEEGSYNWFKNQEYLFLLAMHTANYQDAYTIFSEAMQHKRFAFLPTQVSELWQLYQAYVHLLIDQGEVLPQEGDKQFTSFRINRFLNNMPLYSKDKRGMNIAILTIQILFYIQKRKYMVAIDRMEAIEKYCSRYLFKADTMRSYYFIKALLSIPQGSFHQQAAQRYAEKHLKKMMKISSDASSQFHKIEIIPYEVLWETALNMLENKTVRLSNEQKRKWASRS